LLRGIRDKTYFLEQGVEAINANVAMVAPLFAIGGIKNSLVVLVLRFAPVGLWLRNCLLNACLFLSRLIRIFMAVFKHLRANLNGLFRWVATQLFLVSI
jgi:hypothetical protein